MQPNARPLYKFLGLEKILTMARPKKFPKVCWTSHGTSTDPDANYSQRNYTGSATTKNTIDFVKMNGLGNDFVVIDDPNSMFLEDKAQRQLAIAIAGRDHGVGCDQVLILHPSILGDVKMLVYNRDGSQANMCGNGLRCVGKYLMSINKTSFINIEINRKIFLVKKAGDLISANLGKPELKLDQIFDPGHIVHTFKSAAPPTIVNLSNPHIIFFISTPAAEIPLNEIGPKIENDKMFGTGINVTFAEIRSDNTFRLRVWERGAGETAACGSAASATAVAALARGLAKQSTIKILFEAGALFINLLPDGSVEMIGDATIEYTSTFAWH